MDRLKSKIHIPLNRLYLVYQAWLLTNPHENVRQCFDKGWNISIKFRHRGNSRFAEILAHYTHGRTASFSSFDQPPLLLREVEMKGPVFHLSVFWYFCETGIIWKKGKNCNVHIAGKIWSKILENIRLFNRVKQAKENNQKNQCSCARF